MTDSGAARITIENQIQGLIVGSELHGAVKSFADAAMRAREIDPMITELVRLRCAQVHDCRVCGSLRLAEALDEGLDEETTRRIGDYENGGFDPAAIAALRLADAIILAPGSADQALADELREHFTDSQIAELCLDVVKWSHQKVLVALRLEEPPWTGQAVLSFDAEGRAVVGGSVREFVEGA